MEAFFIWFYCLPIGSIVWLMTFLSLFFFMARHYLEHRPLWRRLCLAALLLWLVGLIFLTLLSRGDDTTTGCQLIPFHSYRQVLSGGNPEILRSNFMNLLLFFPAGLLATSLLPEPRHRVPVFLFIAAVFLILSAAIEFGQYRYLLGRAEIDDVLHNTLGALLGLTLGAFPVGTDQVS